MPHAYREANRFEYERFNLNEGANLHGFAGTVYGERVHGEPKRFEHHFTATFTPFSRINRSRHHWQQTIALCARSPVGCVHRIVNPISDWLVKMKWRNKTLRIKQSRNLNYSVARYSIGCAPVFRSRMPAQTGEWFGSGALGRSVDWLLNLSRLQSIECVFAVSFRSFRLSLGLLPENATTFDLKSKALNDPNARFEIELN